MKPRGMKLFRGVWLAAFLAVAVFSVPLTAPAAGSRAEVHSPDGRNSIVLEGAIAGENPVRFTISRDSHPLIGPSPVGPVLSVGGAIGEDARIVDVQEDKIDESFKIPWGKTTTVVNRCSKATVTLATPSNLRWEVDLRAYDDGVAFRYRLPRQEALQQFEVRDESTQIAATGNPSVLFDTLDSFTTSHEALYEHKPLSAMPVKKLFDMPILMVWANGPAAAITEGRVLHFAGMYLERPSADETVLRCRLSPLPSRKDVSVASKTPGESPWRVVLLADAAGKLLESNLLLCLNDPPQGDFSWAHPGKTSFHWWYGEFEDDYKLPDERDVYFNRHRKYIDFCAQNNIAYHAVSGDGLAWYKQSKTDYGTPMPDADVRVPRRNWSCRRS